MKRRTKVSNEKGNPEQEQPSTTSMTVRRLDPQALIEAAIAKDSPIEILERLVALAKDIRAMQAREAWLAAMARFQELCPAILKNKLAKVQSSKGGHFSYSWASLDAVLGEIQPVMGPLGLSVSFRQRQEKDQAFATCRISHAMGHDEDSGEVMMPITFGDGTASSPQQKVGIAFTYAKRYALLAITGLAPEDDPDLKAEAIQTTASAGKPGAQPQESAREGNVWVGKILNVKTKTGTSTKTGKPWTKYVLQTNDAQEFETFSKTDSDFAKSAGASLVQIAWEQDQYGKTALSVEPADAERPRD